MSYHSLRWRQAGKDCLGAASPHPPISRLIFSDSHGLSKLRLADFNIELGEGAKEHKLQARRSKIEMCMVRIWYRGAAGANEPGSAPLPM